MPARPHILFTATFSTPFIRTDAEFLASRYPVTTVIRSGFTALLHYAILLPRCDITFTWFASTYSALLVLGARLLRKKSVIVLGGVDVAQMPQWKYGIWNSAWRARLVRYALRRADAVLAVAPALKEDAIRLARYDGGNIEVVPTGFDPGAWTPGPEKERLVLTVAKCSEVNRGMVKGLDFLAEIAAAAPDIRFVLVGVSERLRGSFAFPPNVQVLDAVPHEALKERYCRTKVYLQPSRREGLPNALCEAMLCGCTPVATETGGVPEAVGSTGAVIPFGNTKRAVTALRAALDAPVSDAGRDRIMELYPHQRRQDALTDLIGRLNR